MRVSLVPYFLLFSLPVFSQYIGNPAGKSIPLGVKKRPWSCQCGYGGIDIGYQRLNLEADYAVSGPRGPYLKETSKLQDSRLTFYGGGNYRGLELEARIGGIQREIDEHAFTEPPLDDGWGLDIGGSARFGFSPVRHLRLGLGGQLTYSWTEGDGYVYDPDTDILLSEDIEGELLAGQLFTGISLDFETRNLVTFSPYLGTGLEFIDGELSVDEWYGGYRYEDDVADLDEETPGFIFGGLDIHLANRVRFGIEGRGNDEGWSAFGSFGVSF